MMFEHIKSAFGIESGRGLQRAAKERGYGVKDPLPPAFTQEESIEKRREREIEQQIGWEQRNPEYAPAERGPVEDVLERAARRREQHLRTLKPESEHGDLRPEWAMDEVEREQIKQERERQERERREREIEEEGEHAREYDTSSSLVPNPAGHQLERAREKEPDREMEMEMSR